MEKTIKNLQTLTEKDKLMLCVLIDNYLKNEAFPQTEEEYFMALMDFYPQEFFETANRNISAAMISVLEEMANAEENDDNNFFIFEVEFLAKNPMAVNETERSAYVKVPIHKSIVNIGQKLNEAIEKIFPQIRDDYFFSGRIFLNGKIYSDFQNKKVS